MAWMLSIFFELLSVRVRLFNKNLELFRPKSLIGTSLSNLKDPLFYPYQHTKVTYPLEANKKLYKNL